MAIAMAAAATTSTSVCTVCFQRFWLMMKIRPRNTPMASGRERCSSQAMTAMISASSTGGTSKQDVDQPVEQEIQAIREGPEDGVEIVGKEAEERLAPGAYRDLVIDHELRNRIHLTPLRPGAALLSARATSSCHRI